MSDAFRVVSSSSFADLAKNDEGFWRTAIGARVIHRALGQGEILDIVGSGNHLQVIIRFASGAGRFALTPYKASIFYGTLATIAFSIEALAKLQQFQLEREEKRLEEVQLAAQRDLQRRVDLERLRVQAKELSASRREVGFSKGKASNRADRARELQQEIAALRRQLANAYQHRDDVTIHRIRQELLERRLDFCRVLRDRSPQEVEALRAQYQRQMLGEFGDAGSYRNVCWACSTPVDAEANDRCQPCTWLVCACGACLCPGFSGGPSRSLVECTSQIERLGNEVYTRLVGERNRQRY